MTTPRIPRTLTTIYLSGWPFPVRSLGPTDADQRSLRGRQPAAVSGTPPVPPHATPPPVPIVLAVLRGDGEA